MPNTPQDTSNIERALGRVEGNLEQLSFKFNHLNETLDSRITDLDEKIESKIDRIENHVGDIKTILAQQHGSLVEHIKRTEIAEQNIALLRSDLKPVETHVAMIKGGVKLIGIICMVGGLVAAFLKLFI